MSKFDVVYRSLLLSNFFTKGWGKPEDIRNIFELRRKLANRETAKTYVERSHPVTITEDDVKSDHRRLKGYFRTPLADIMPSLVPPESEKAHFQLILPVKEPSQQGRLKPICIQYAGTGDHGFWRRRKLMAIPMLKERGISSIILENPFYGVRKPKHQFRSCLQQVSDLFVMGAALILESLVLFDFSEREGFCPIIAHGISMGGHMASLGATVSEKPIGLVPCLSWTSASQTFTKGVLTGSINWDLLQKQYQTQNAYRDEVAKMIEFEESAHKAGIDFAQQMDKIAQVQEEKRKRLWNIFSSLERRPNGNANSNHPDIKEHMFTASLPSSDSDSISTSIPKSVAESIKDTTFQMVPKIIRSDAKDVKDSLHREAVYFMRGIMDECTHLKNYDIPCDPSLIYIVVAENDAYQPREGIAALPDIWPGANIRYINGSGHVSSYLFKQNVFREAIYDCIDKYVEKYMQTT